MSDAGLKRFLGDGIRFATNRASAFYVGLRLLVAPTSSFYLNLPSALPPSTQAIFCDNSGNISFAATGTVTSVGVAVPSWLSVSGSPVTTAGTITISAASGQTANQILATPDGATGAVGLRALVANDIPSLLASKISNFDTQVRTSRLDQMAAPTASVAFGNQRITSLADGTALSDAATWGQVQSLFNGQDNKANVRVATTANITLSGTQTVDGVALVAGDRVLVKNQTTGSQNGIYIVAAGAWSRATDADISAEVTSGLNVFVSAGGQAATLWFLATSDPITLGTTSLTFTQIGATISYLAGNGLQLTGNTFSVLGTTNRISVSGSGVDISSAYVGQTSITTVGTISTGTWQGTPIGQAYGGTGANTAAGARANLGAPGIFRQAFTSADLVAGLLTVTHNLGQQVVSLQVFDNNNRLIYPDEITLTSSTVTTVDLTAFVSGFTGTWNVVAVG